LWVVTHQNVKLVYRWERFWAERDLSQVAAVFDPEVVIDFSRSVFNPAVYRGYDGLEQLVGAVDDMWETFHPEIEEVVEAGDAVMTSMRISGIGRDGVEAGMEMFQVWTFRNGRILRMTGAYRDRAEALAAAESAAGVER
jgi:ketosteroid isomerase-like protein